MQTVREVYSLLMPIQDGRLVIPRAAVAEVMGFSRPKDRPDDAPDFMLGYVDWQEQLIPLVSFEAARGNGVPELGRRTRIAVVFGIAGRLKPDVFAMVTQGYPYLVRVNENVLQPEETDGDDPLILARVRMANEKPYIPDLETLEQRIAEGLGFAAAGDPAGQSLPVDELDSLDTGEDDEEFAISLDQETTSDSSSEGEQVPRSVGEASVDASEAAPVENDGDTMADSVGDETPYVAPNEVSSVPGAGEGGDDDDFAIDLSDFEVGEEHAGDQASDDVSLQDDSEEIDLSDITIDFEDDDKPGD